MQKTKIWFGKVLLVGVVCLLGCGPANTPTSPFPSLVLSGAEIWQIDGNAVEIENTNVVTLPNEPAMFAINALVDFEPGEKDLALAKKIADYGLNHGYLYNTLGVRTGDKVADILPTIGVALIHKTGNRLVHSSKAFRFQFDLSEFNEPLPTLSSESLQPYLGRWVMDDPFIAFEFRGDQTVSLEFRGVTNEGRYALDLNHEIPWLDVVWENSQRIRLIMALTDEGLKIQQSYSERGRPAGFTQDCALLQRQPDEPFTP